MARIVELPAELLLAILSVAPLYCAGRRDNLLDNGFNLTCKHLSHIWKTAFWNSVSITTLSEFDSIGWEGPRYIDSDRSGNNKLARTLKFNLAHFHQNPSLALNLKYTRQLHLCVHQHGSWEITMDNIDFLADAQDKFVGGLDFINVRTFRSFSSQYGNYIIKFLRRQHPRAYLRFVVEQPTDGLRGSLDKDSTTTSIATSMAELDADEFCITTESPPSHTGQMVEVIGKVRNAATIKYENGLWHCPPDIFGNTFSTLRSLVLKRVVLPSSDVQIPDCVDYLNLKHCDISSVNTSANAGTETQLTVKTMASDITITRFYITRKKKLVLQAPQVKVLTMDMAIYSMPFEGLRHSLPQFGTYQLHLTSVLYPKSYDDGNDELYDNPNTLPWTSDLKQAIANSTSLQHFVPSSTNSDLWDAIPEIPFSPGWVRYLFDMFVVNTTGKLQHLEIAPPVEAYDLEYIINRTVIGPLIGEIIANQKSLTSIKMSVYVKDEDRAETMFFGSPLSQILRPGGIDGGETTMLSMCYHAWIKMDEYTRLYNLALSKATKVERMFGHPVRLSGAKIVAPVNKEKKRKGTL